MFILFFLPAFLKSAEFLISYLLLRLQPLTASALRRRHGRPAAGRRGTGGEEQGARYREGEVRCGDEREIREWNNSAVSIKTQSQKYPAFYGYFCEI